MLNFRRGSRTVNNWWQGKNDHANSQTHSFNGFCSDLKWTHKSDPYRTRIGSVYRKGITALFLYSKLLVYGYLKMYPLVIYMKMVIHLLTWTWTHYMASWRVHIHHWHTLATENGYVSWIVTFDHWGCPVPPVYTLFVEWISDVIIALPPTPVYLLE